MALVTSLGICGLTLLCEQLQLDYSYTVSVCSLQNHPLISCILLAFPADCSPLLSSAALISQILHQASGFHYESYWEGSTQLSPLITDALLAGRCGYRHC